LLLRIISKIIGCIDKPFNLVAAGYKARFIYNAYIKHLKPELYYLQKITHDPDLKEYLKHSEDAGFRFIENNLPGILKNIADKMKNQSLHSAVVSWGNMIRKYDDFIDNLYTEGESDLDSDADEEEIEKEPDLVSQQNVATEQMVNHILTHLKPKLARRIKK